MRPSVLRSAFGASAIVAGAACSRERPAPERAVPSAVPAVSDAGTTTPRASASPPSTRPPLTDASVRALVERWARAQNANDFPAYEALYAERFTGVKRAGTSTTRLGRAAWMADRKTMIAPGLLVEASDVKVDVTRDAATVRFVQRYKSPRFEDVGPKQLVVIGTDTGPRIAREEMLSSSIQLQGLGKRLAARLHAAEPAGIFLEAGLPAKAAKGELRARRVENLGVEEVDADVDETALTTAQRAYVGRSFTAYDAKGAPCPAVVRGLEVRSLVTPHFGIVQLFADKEQYPDRKLAEKEQAATYYGLAGEAGRYLFGRFEEPCPGATFAIDGSAVPVIAKSSAARERNAVLAAFRALPAYKSLAADFTAQHADLRDKPWESYEGALSVDAFRPERGAPVIVVGARGGTGCGDFWGSLTAVFGAATPQLPTLLGVVNASPSTPHLLVALDLDQDGELELVTGPDAETASYALLHRGPAGTFVRDPFFSVPFLDCPC